MESLLEYFHKDDLTYLISFTSITLHETCDDNDELVCFACADLVIGGPTYILETDDHDIDRCYLHKSCAELPGKIQHPRHPHPLTVRLHPHPLAVRGRSSYGFICDGCGHVSFGYQYRCSKKCKFKLDLRCVSKNEGQALKERVEKRIIYHRHKLQLVDFHLRIPTRFSKDIRCCCCLKSCPDGRDPTYVCNICIESEIPFFIRKSCLDTIPPQVQSSFHPEHPLFTHRLRDDDENNCGVCADEITGFALTCDECDIKFHVSCGGRTTRGLRVHLHQHDMYYVILRSPVLRCCTICEAKCEGALYRCVKCDVSVHMECIPLPEIVEHESHDHPLKLTDSVVTHRDDDEYRCDICEEEGNIKHHSYYCDECNYIAHIDCVHSEYQDNSPKASCLDPRGKGKVEKETDDAEEKTEDEVYEIDSSSQKDWGSEDSFDSQRYSNSDVDDSIEKFRTKIEELALDLEAVANLDPRMEKVKADMVKLVFQFDDLTEKIIQSRY